MKVAFPHAVENLTYEGLLEDPQNVLFQIAEKYDIGLIGSEITNVVRSTKNQAKGYEYYRDYYINERWQEALSRDDIIFINSQLDRSVVQNFGYRIIE